MWFIRCAAALLQMWHFQVSKVWQKCERDLPGVVCSPTGSVGLSRAEDGKSALQWLSDRSTWMKSPLCCSEELLTCKYKCVCVYWEFFNSFNLQVCFGRAFLSNLNEGWGEPTVPQCGNMSWPWNYFILMIKKIFRLTTQTSSVLNQAVQRKIIFQEHLIPITESEAYPELFLQAEGDTAHSWGHNFQVQGRRGVRSSPSCRGGMSQRLPWEEPGSLCSARLLILCLSCFKISSLKEAVKMIGHKSMSFVWFAAAELNPGVSLPEERGLCSPGTSQHPSLAAGTPPQAAVLIWKGQTLLLGASQEPPCRIQGCSLGLCPPDRPIHHWFIEQHTWGRDQLLGGSPKAPHSAWLCAHSRTGHQPCWAEHLHCCHLSALKALFSSSVTLNSLLQSMGNYLISNSSIESKLIIAHVGDLVWKWWCKVNFVYCNTKLGAELEKPKCPSTTKIQKKGEKNEKNLKSGSSFYWHIVVWKHQTFPLGWGGVWAVLYELGAGGCLVPRNPGRVGWGTTCSEPLRDFPVGRRHWGVVKECGQGMMNEGGGEKKKREWRIWKEVLNSDCGSVTPQMGLTSVFSSRNKTSPWTGSHSYSSLCKNNPG